MLVFFVLFMFGFAIGCSTDDDDDGRFSTTATSATASMCAMCVSRTIPMRNCDWRMLDVRIRANAPEIRRKTQEISLQ